MRTLADALDGGLGGAHEPHDLAVFQFGMIADQPKDSVRPVLPARHRGVARSALVLLFRHPHLAVGELQAKIFVLFGVLDFFARELAGLDRVHPLDALRGIAIGDRLYLERMQFAEFRDLVE